MAKNKELLFFDCNASYGPCLDKHREERWTLDHLLEDLDLAGIAGALVIHAQTMYYDPMLANLQLIRDIEKYRDRLFPCWMAMPALSGDFPDVSTFMRAMREHDVRAVRIEPRLMGLPIAKSVWHELHEALADENILVVTGADLYSDLGMLDEFLKIFSKTPVLMLNAYWTQWRWVVHLMRSHDNLHMDFSAFQANRAVEYIAENFGAHRCLFGTGLPKKAPGAARGFIDWSLLSQAAAADIAGGNLKKLLRGAGPEKIPAPGQWHDSLTEAARHGEPLPCLIVDNHCHILHDDGANAGRAYVMYKGDADHMIELTRKIGIDKTAIMSWAGPLSGDTDLGNEIVEHAVRRYPDEFIGVATVRPELQSEAEIEAVIEKYHGQLKFPGLKPFPRKTMDFNDPGFDRWYQFADQNRLYMVYDPATFWAEGMAIIEELVRKYPNMILSLDHCGRSWPFAKWAVQVIKRFPENVYAQLNFTAVTNGVIEYLVEQVGEDHVMFGTDAPMRDPRPQASWLVFTRLPERVKRKIFGENFEKILARTFGA